ncbi:MAG TPA: hypothetical protein VFW98_15195 [Gemmatimonadaceae bacterium]|nr:hypothetical protein [Gemmatimonadaceae bacterium]
MERIEEMTAVRAAVPQALRALTTVSRFAEWMAPDVDLTPHTHGDTLGPGDRFELRVLGLDVSYLVEAVSEREVVFSFSGPWSGRERWSFIADGADTLVRRTYEVEDGSPAAVLAWRTVGRFLVLAHLKYELARFRSLVEADPGARGEIESGSRELPPPPSTSSFPIDEG